MTAEFRVAAVQMDVRLGAVVHNRDRMAQQAREAVSREGARLVVFPECAVTGYCFESRDEALDHAESADDGPSVRLMTALCAELDIHVVYGYLECDGDALYNALASVGPNGPVAGYRKTHLPHLGVDHFVDPGAGPYVAHDTPLCRLAMNVCYDGAFPEASRVFALDGADLIVLPTNWPPGAEAFAEHGINTRALENTVYYLSANRVGLERGFRFIGTSRICDPQGATLASADDESEVILAATIDPLQARKKRIDRVPGRHWIDRIADRRPDLYGRLSSDG